MIPVPANSSRLFDNYLEAVRQPIGYLDFQVSPSDFIIKNQAFNPSLIIYDENYSTVNEVQLKSAFNVFQPILQEFSSSIFIDIGCGQGEFVSKIRGSGSTSIGFDPVMREPTEGLYKKFFKAQEFEFGKTDQHHKVFVMRCVLPHIQDPWRFLDSIFSRYPNSMIVLQHQNFS